MNALRTLRETLRREFLVAPCVETRSLRGTTHEIAQLVFCSARFFAGGFAGTGEDERPGLRPVFLRDDQGAQREHGGEGDRRDGWRQQARLHLLRRRSVACVGWL